MRSIDPTLEDPIRFKPIVRGTGGTRHPNIDKEAGQLCLADNSFLRARSTALVVGKAAIKHLRCAKVFGDDLSKDSPLESIFLETGIASGAAIRTSFQLACDDLLSQKQASCRLMVEAR